MFKTRLISGILLVIVALFAIVSGGDILFGILLVLSLIGMSELYKIADVHKKLLGVTGYVAAAAYYILLHRVAAGKAPGAFAAGQINEITCIGILFLIVLMAVYVFSFPKYRSEQVMLTYFGMFYVAVMLSYIYQTRLLPHGAFLVGLVFICSWGCDTCAYCVGMLIGKHKSEEVCGRWYRWDCRRCTSWSALCCGNQLFRAGCAGKCIRVCIYLCSGRYDLTSRRSCSICDQTKP